MPTANDIVKVIAEHLGLSPEDLDRQASLKDELGLGPIELNDLLSDLSQKFNVSFESSEVANLTQVDDIVSLVEDNLLD